MTHTADDNPRPPAAGRTARLVDVLRTVATLATIPLCFTYGMGVWAVTRNRRRAVNRMIESWADIGAAVAGLRLDIDHPERIDSARPAVYIFNHRSAADVLIVCMLMRRNFTGVAKKELRHNPILGPPLALCDAVFVDRSDQEQAIRAMQPATDTLHGGISIVIAPEGTRSDVRPVGPFKKGAFRMAMAAKVPLVPLIIHNADEVVDRHGLTIRAGTVRCTVGAPMATEAWTVEEVEDRIEDAHRLFRTTLGAGA